MTPLEYDIMWSKLNKRKHNLEIAVEMSDEMLLANGKELCGAFRSLLITVLTELHVRAGGFDL